jgi:hypothetical protein
MKQNKYEYYKIIQSFYGEWCDDSFYETDSSYNLLDRKAFQADWKAYREALKVPLRVVCRRVSVLSALAGSRLVELKVD